MTEESTHQKLSANRGAIARNLPKRHHERVTASDMKPVAHSKYRRRRRGAPSSRHLLGGILALSRSFSYFRRSHHFNQLQFQISSSEIICFHLLTYSFQLAPRSWSQAEIMSITSNWHGGAFDILNYIFDIRGLLYVGGEMWNPFLCPTR
jgi:hypothetical protein